MPTRQENRPILEGLDPRDLGCGLYYPLSIVDPLRRCAILRATRGFSAGPPHRPKKVLLRLCGQHCYPLAVSNSTPTRASYRWPFSPARCSLRATARCSRNRCSCRPREPSSRSSAPCSARASFTRCNTYRPPTFGSPLSCGTAASYFMAGSLAVSSRRASISTSRRRLTCGLRIVSRRTLRWAKRSRGSVAFLTGAAGERNVTRICPGAWCFRETHSPAPTRNSWTQASLIVARNFPCPYIRRSSI